MRVIWRLSRDAEVVIMDNNLFLFKFANRKDKNRVLDRAPWSFDKHLLAFKDYDGGLRASKYVFDKATFWIQVFDLPLKMMHHDIVEKIGGKLGIFKQVDEGLSRVGWGKYLCIRVEMDITKPLRRFISLT